MGNGYNHHLHHQSMHLQHKATFLPMLCSRPSIKDVTFPKWQDRSGSFSDDPLSPKISCMGQVKRKNRVVGFPATSRKLIITNKNGSSNSIKYFKLRKLFSGKNILTGSPAAAAATATATASCRRRDLLVNGISRPRYDGGKENSTSINIENMDPPLPVIKRVQKQDDKGDGDTLWKRRSHGVALKNLQLQLNSNQEQTTV